MIYAIYLVVYTKKDTDISITYFPLQVRLCQVYIDYINAHIYRAEIPDAQRASVSKNENIGVNINIEI